MSVVDDLQAFLFLVPYVARRANGVPIAELLEHLSMTRDELACLLDRAASVGTPDGSPDELVEVYLEADRVHVALPQSFGKAPRFTVEEAAALLFVLAPLRESALPELSRHALRLTDALLALSSQRVKALSTALRDAVSVLPSIADRPEILEALERAVTERRAIDVEYYTASRDSFGRRRLRPWALFPYRGAWYVLSDERKTFKVARMRSVMLADERFPAPSPEDLEPYRRSQPFGFAPPPEGERDASAGPTRVPGPLGPTMRGYLRRRRGAAVFSGPDEDRKRLLDEARALRDRHAGPPKTLSIHQLSDVFGARTGGRGEGADLP